MDEIKAQEQRNIFDKLMSLRDVPFLYIARFVPKWITPNLITTARIFLIIPIYLLYRQEQYFWTAVIFILFLISDALDGAVARHHNKITRLGALLDPAADKIIFVSVLLLAGTGKLSTAVIISILSLEVGLVLMATVIAVLLVKIFNYHLKIGANSYGKMKFGSEGVSVSLLLLWPKANGVVLSAEILMWIAVIFALLSLVTHFRTKEKENA